MVEIAVKYRISACCNEQLYKYNKDWDDGVCSKCKKHSPRKGSKHDVPKPRRRLRK